MRAQDIIGLVEVVVVDSIVIAAGSSSSFGKHCCWQQLFVELC